MNKTITMYELLGLIKDGKAPKKIKWNNMIWAFEYKKNSISFKYNYTNENNDIIEDYLVLDSLEDKVEILDEEDEFIEIEEMPYCEENTLTNMKTSSDISTEAIRLIDSNFKTLGEYINQLIHNQKILIEKMKEQNNANKE